MKETQQTRKAIYINSINKRYDCSILNALHAPQANDMEKAYSDIKSFTMNGWCYSGHRNFIKSIMHSILFLHKKDEFFRSPILHILDVTDFKVMPYIVYAQDLLNRIGIDCQLSFNCDSAMKNAVDGKYQIFPDFRGMQHINMSSDFTELDEYSHLGCDCPVCLESSVADMCTTSKIAAHNFALNTRYKETFEGLLSLNIPEITDTLPREMVTNFKALDDSFSRMGQKGIDILDSKFENKAVKHGAIAAPLASFFG